MLINECGHSFCCQSVCSFGWYRLLSLQKKILWTTNRPLGLLVFTPDKDHCRTFAILEKLEQLYPIYYTWEYFVCQQFPHETPQLSLWGHPWNQIFSCTCSTAWLLGECYLRWRCGFVCPSPSQQQTVWAPRDSCIYIHSLFCSPDCHTRAVFEAFVCFSVLYPNREQLERHRHRISGARIKNHLDCGLDSVSPLICLWWALGKRCKVVM